MTRAASLWRGETLPILASQSFARKALLVNAGIPVETIPADIDERGIQQQSGLTRPDEIATLLATEKARHVSRAHPDRYVIGADQTLSLGNRLFSKPPTREAAADQIAALAGEMHELHSAVSVMKNGATLFSHISIARMTMRQLTRAEIDAYIEAAGDAVTTSVGAYQLEGAGVHLFETIDGDHFTILGLPLLPLLDFLRGEKLLSV